MYHIFERLRMHYIVVLVRQLDSTILSQIAVGIGFRKRKPTSERLCQQDKIFYYVACIYQCFRSILPQRYKFIFGQTINGLFYCQNGGIILPKTIYSIFFAQYPNLLFLLLSV